MKTSDFMIALAVVGVLLQGACACTKTGEGEDAEGAKMVRVCIRAGSGADSGEMATRGSTGDEVAALLSTAFPTGGVSLTLTNSVSGVSYTATTGSEVLLPVGEYAVVGKYKPSDKGDYNAAAYVSNTPSFSVSCTLAVSEGVTEYCVPVQWTSWAVCVDATEVGYWTWRNYNGSDAVPPFITEGDTQLFFVCGTITAGTMKVTLTPSDLEHYATTTWELATSAANVYGVENGLQTEAGKWYRLHPDGVVTESGSLTLSAGDWVCGAE